MPTESFTSADIGQFIMSGISGLTLTPEEQAFLARENIGGVLLFAHNYQSPTQLAQLTHSIQQLQGESPLLIGVDQEGGRVRRFRDSFQQFPAMGEVGLLDSPELCYELHQILAAELKAAGVNLVFAPVCDVLTNPQNEVIGDRAFGSDPQQVGRCAAAAIRGLATHSVISVAKHFPGHGDTQEDSHVLLPRVVKSLAQLRECELPPFQAAVAAGADMVLMAHLQVRALDPDHPTTLAPRAYHWLREELGSSLPVISDDMEMGAISAHFTHSEAAVRALGAGCDILVYRSMAAAREGYLGLGADIARGNICSQELADKLGRIRALKKRRLGGNHESYNPEQVVQALDSPRAREFGQQLWAKLANLKAPRSS